jgi:hypothetical protein
MLVSFKLLETDCRLKLEIAQNNSVAREIVTDRARFEKMMEKNPAVKTLWERFKLVID